MKKILLVFCIVNFCLVKGYNQKLYVPGGFSSSGVGSSANSTNVGIGTNNPQWGQLQINAASDYTTALRLQMGSFSMGGTATFGIDAPGIANGRFFVNSNGNIGIGKAIPNFKLDVSGDINFTGNIYKNGQLFSSGGGSSLWAQSGSNLYYSGGNVGIGGDPGATNFKIINNSDIPTFELANASNLRLNVYVNNGQIVYRALGGPHQLVFHMADNNNDGNSFIQFSDDANGGWYKIFNNRTVCIDGKLNAKEIEVKTNVWADDVFAKDYKLMSLTELEKYISTHQHLPGVATEAEVKENGINLAEMNATLLRKVEELTKYVIDLKKEIELLKK